MRCDDIELSPECTCETLARPFAPGPSDGANSVATATVLSWNEQVVSPAPASAPPRVAKTIYGDDDRLDEVRSSRGAAYRWQVVAKNACGGTEGPIWRFTVARDAAPGDADGDGDIDPADLLALQECVSTGGADACSHFDMDADCDVDLADYLTFVSHFTGSR